MEPEHLCYFCDNVMKDGATKCHICEADIAQMPINVSSLEKVEKVEKENDFFIKNGEIAGDVDISEDPLSVERSEMDSSWTCTQCTFVNRSNLVCCSVCFQEKVSPVASDNININVDSDWTCVTCQLKNKPEKQFCEICFNSKVPVDEIKRSASFELGISSPSNEFQEDLNTFQSINNIDLSKHRSLPRRKSLQDSIVHRFPFLKNKDRWQCRNSSCDKNNRANLTKCKRCGTNRNFDVIEEENFGENGDVNEKTVVTKKPTVSFHNQHRRRKGWFCSDQNCRCKNKNGKINCKKCGQPR